MCCYKNLPKIQCCTFKLGIPHSPAPRLFYLPILAVVLLLQEQRGTSAPRAEGNLHPKSCRGSPSHLLHPQAWKCSRNPGKGRSRDLPTNSDTITFPRLFLPVSHRKIRSNHSAASPSRHWRLLSMRTDSSSIFLTLDSSSILVWDLYLF